MKRASLLLFDYGDVSLNYEKDGEEIYVLQEGKLSSLPRSIRFLD